MNKEEILNKYIDLIDKGYCCACNELNCIDNFPHAKITHAIRELQQENQELKLELSGYRQAILNDKEMLGLKEENQKYKEVIDKLKNKTKENIENAKCEITTLTIGDKAYYQYIEKILDNYVDILKEVK